MTARSIIVHATSLLRRAHLTVSAGRTDSEGAPTHGLYVVVRALRTAIGFKSPTTAVAVIGELTDDDDAVLTAQHARLHELFSALGVPCVAAREDAHVVASYAHAAQAAGGDVVVVGGDKRLAQLVSPSCWWYDAFKNARYTPEMVKKRFLVDPKMAGEWLGLVGDDDTLPGVTGIGKKGAATAITQYGSVAGALDNVADIKGRLGNVLRADPDAARRAVVAATLRTDKSLPTELEACPFAPPEPERIQATYAAYGFYDFLDNQAGEDAPATRIVTRPGDIDVMLRALGDAPVALDVITGAPSPVRGPLVGLVLGNSDGACWYIPWRPNLVPATGELATWLAAPTTKKFGHNIKAAAVALANQHVTLAGVIADTEHTSHLYEPSRFAPHDLDVLARRILHRPLPEEDAVLGVGRRRKDWSQLDDAAVAAYAGARARAIVALWTHQQAQPAFPNLPALQQEYSDLAATLVRMERCGMPCDVGSLANAGDDFERIAAELQDEIHALAGEPFLLSSTKQLGRILFEKLELPIYRRTKTGWSTSNDALERIEHAHPIVPLVIRYKRLRRLKDSWVTTLIRDVDDDGRVRSTFHPARSFSGRLVNSQPDLGRVPGRTAEMKRIRRAFVATPGHVIMSVDFKQLGLYVLAHLSGDPALTAPLMRDDDMHKLTAAAVLNLEVSDIDRDKRQLGKVVNFATFASQGASALAHQLGLGADETKVIIERFFKRYAVTDAFFCEQLELARTRGFIVTLAGRRWPIGDLHAPDIHMRSYAERLAKRATHEASVADVSRRALLAADRALDAAGMQTRVLHSILDEVIFESPRDEHVEAAAVASEAMRNVFALRVPLRVGAKAGPNWADMEPLG